MRSGIRQVEIDFAADKIIDYHMLPRRTEPQCAFVFENVTGIPELFQVAFVNLSALALQIGPEITACVRSFIPIQTEPFEAFVNGSRRFLSVALDIGIFDSQNESAAVMPRE